MKVSKNLAIDIAKQLKSKYDEIRNSKNKLIDRLQKVEVSRQLTKLINLKISLVTYR